MREIEIFLVKIPDQLSRMMSLLSLNSFVKDRKLGLSTASMQGPELMTPVSSRGED